MNVNNFVILPDECYSITTDHHQCPFCWGIGVPYELHMRRTGTEHNLPRGSSDDWWVIATANAAGTNGLTRFPKHGGTRDNKFLVIRQMTDLFNIRTPSTLTAGLSSSKAIY
jgi:hypothetical protein